MRRAFKTVLNSSINYFVGRNNVSKKFCNFDSLRFFATTTDLLFPKDKNTKNKSFKKSTKKTSKSNILLKPNDNVQKKTADFGNESKNCGNESKNCQKSGVKPGKIRREEVNFVKASTPVNDSPTQYSPSSSPASTPYSSKAAKKRNPSGKVSSSPSGDLRRLFIQEKLGSKMFQSINNLTGGKTVQTHSGRMYTLNTTPLDPKAQHGERSLTPEEVQQIVVEPNSTSNNTSMIIRHELLIIDKENNIKLPLAVASFYKNRFEPREEISILRRKYCPLNLIQKKSDSSSSSYPSSSVQEKSFPASFSNEEEFDPHDKHQISLIRKDSNGIVSIKETVAPLEPIFTFFLTSQPQLWPLSPNSDKYKNLVSENNYSSPFLSTVEKNLNVISENDNSKLKKSFIKKEKAYKLQKQTLNSIINSFNQPEYIDKIEILDDDSFNDAFHCFSISIIVHHDGLKYSKIPSLNITGKSKPRE